jgi:hypothetical protein
MTPPDTDAAAYEVAFVIRCHQLIGLGYASLDASAMQHSQETEITGELVDAMNTILWSDACPIAMEHFETKDDPPQSVRGAKGRARPRVDIEIVRTGRGDRRRLHFEAKRLYRGDSVSTYLGPDGLGMFLNGSYAKDDAVGGMLGYVQNETPPAWALKIQQELHRQPATYGLELPPGLIAASEMTTLQDSYQSGHARLTGKRPIAIFHTLLVLM